MTPSPATRFAFPRIGLLSRPALVAAAGVAIVVWLLYLAGGAVSIFLIAALIAVILDPLVTRLTARGVPRAVAAAIVVLLVTLGLVLVTVIVGAEVADEALAFVAAAPGWLERSVSWYEGAPIPHALRDILDVLLANAAHGVAGANLSGAALDLASQALGFVLVTFGLLPFLLFFALSDRPRSVRRVVAAVPAPWRGDMVAIGRIVLRSFSRYLRGEALLMAVLAGVTWVGLVGVSTIVDPRIRDFALLLALLAGVSELVPMLGPWIATVPAVAFAATLSPEAAIAVAALYLVIAVVEGQLLSPVVHGREFDLHPITVGLALLTGGAVMGVLGTIVALPVLAAGLEIFAYVFRRSSGRLPSPRVEVDEPGSAEAAPMRIRGHAMTKRL
jgi:predicted PurR-regulated permease PerM